MRSLILLLPLLIIGSTCNPEGKNLTRETTIAGSIEIHATPSAIYAECMAKNAVAGAGGNTKNCDDLKEFYINLSIWQVCEEKPNKTGCYKWLKEGK